MYDSLNQWHFVSTGMRDGVSLVDVMFLTNTADFGCTLVILVDSLIAGFMSFCVDQTADSVIPSPNDFSTIWLRTMGNSNNQISGENIEAQSQENYGQRSQEIEDRTLMEWSRTFQPLDSERRLSSLDAKDQIVVEPVEMVISIDSNCSLLQFFQVDLLI